MTAAGVGAVGYAIASGAQWWNWEQFAVFQMVLLVLRRRLSAARAGTAALPSFPRQRTDQRVRRRLSGGALLLLPRCSSAAKFGSLLAALPLIVQPSSEPMVEAVRKTAPLPRSRSLSPRAFSSSEAGAGADPGRYRIALESDGIDERRPSASIGR